MNHHRRSAQVWHVFSRDFTVLPAHPHVHPQSEWAISAFAFQAITGTHSWLISPIAVECRSNGRPIVAESKSNSSCDYFVISNSPSTDRWICVHCILANQYRYETPKHKHCGLVEFAYLRIYVYNMLVNIMHLYNILDIGIICPRMWMFVHVHVYV